MNLVLFIKNLIIYYGLYELKYNFSSKIDFGSNKSNQYFKKKLKKSKLYFEYGSGNSTLYAKKQKILFISIEGQKDIYKNLKFKKKINVCLFSLGIVKKFSTPYFIKSNKNKIRNYVTAIRKINKNPDLILIDGRFRVLCFFHIMSFLKQKKLNKTEVMFDDFDRSEYVIVNDYFKVKNIGRIGIVKLANQKKKFNIKKIEKQFLLDPS